MLTEAFRHAKAIGRWDQAQWDQAQDVFTAAAISLDSDGVILGEDAIQVLNQVVDLLCKHRVWSRLEATSTE